MFFSLQCEEWAWRCDLQTWLSDYWLQLWKRRDHALAVFSLVAHCSTAQCGAVFCHAAGSEGKDMGCFPLCSQAWKLHRRPILSSASLFLFYPSSSSAHLSSINLRCLSDPERSHCAWLKWLSAHFTTNYRCWRLLHLPPFSASRSLSCISFSISSWPSCISACYTVHDLIRFFVAMFFTALVKGCCCHFNCRF